MGEGALVDTLNLQPVKIPNNRPNFYVRMYYLVRIKVIFEKSNVVADGDVRKCDTPSCYEHLVLFYMKYCLSQNISELDIGTSPSHVVLIFSVAE